MPTSTEYNLLREAILNKHQAHFTYRRHRRETCPHAVGLGPNGNEQVLVYQFGGSSSSGGSISTVAEADRWRCLSINEITDLTTEPGEWHTAANHSQPSSCLKVIDVEVDFSAGDGR